jgi:hypothetical protein
MSFYSFPSDGKTLFLNQSLLEKIRLNRSLWTSNSLYSHLWNLLFQRALQALDLDLTTERYLPYNGRNYLEFISSAENVMNSMLYLSFIGAIESNYELLYKGKNILLLWAKSSPYPGIMLEKEAGLTLSRFLDRICESYSILRPLLSAEENESVLIWLRHIGCKILQDHHYWLTHHQIQGPSNHICWHIFGLLVVGIFTYDYEMISYALDDPANPWNYQKLLCSAIFQEESRHHFRFREGKNSLGQLYSFNEVIHPGEIFDRYRTLSAVDEKRPPCGLYYCMFSLRALIYTAHLLAVNMIHFSETSENPILYNNSVLKKSLHFYGTYYYSQPLGKHNQNLSEPLNSSELFSSLPSCYSPYVNQLPDYENFGVFLVGSIHYQDDKVLQAVIEKNILQKSSGSEIEENPLLGVPHPITTPVVYLALLYLQNDRKVENTSA